MEAKSEAKAINSIVPKIHLRLVPIRMDHRPNFFCQARKYEALKAGRMLPGSSALCSILINE